MPTPHTSDGIGTLRLTERSWEAKAALAACAAARVAMVGLPEVLSEVEEAKEAKAGVVEVAAAEMDAALEVAEEAGGDFVAEVVSVKNF